MSSPNRDLLVRVSTRLKPLLDQLVFVGGQVTELLITDPVAIHVRPTDDVDVICEVANMTEYFQLGKKLKEVGFSEDTSKGAPICRWRTSTDVIDVMPTVEEILGFKGSWYPAAIRTAHSYSLTPDLDVRVVSAPVFLATKWEAFGDRGEGAWYVSHDVQDIVLIVAGREELQQEIQAVAEDLRDYLAKSTRSMLASGVAEDVIVAALPEAHDVPGLLNTVMERFKHIASFHQ